MNKKFIKFNLSDVADIIVGGDKPKIFSLKKTNKNKIPVFANSEKKDGLYGYTDTARITEPAVTIAARGTVGFVALRREPYFPIIRLLSLVPNITKLDVNYLYYNLKLYRQAGIGSNQPQITIPSISSRTILLPSLNTQQKISKVLLSLDNKIMLNNKINEQLEVIAKTIYEYWFVQFDFPDENGKPYKSSGGKMIYNEILKRYIPKGWTLGTLNDLATISGGSTPSSKESSNFCDKGTPWITPADMSDNIGKKFISRGKRDVSEKGVKSASLQIYPKGTVLLTSRAPVGYLAISRNEVTTNQGFKSFIPNKEFPEYYIFYALDNCMKGILNYSSGSTFKEISGSVLKTVPIPKPPASKAKEFSEQISKILSLQNNCEIENEELGELRDWLLPMLMNGQVTVSEAS